MRLQRNVSHDLKLVSHHRFPLSEFEEMLQTLAVAMQTPNTLNTPVATEKCKCRVFLRITNTTLYKLSATYTYKYTVFRKKTPTHIFFHISMNYLWI